MRSEVGRFPALLIAGTGLALGAALVVGGGARPGPLLWIGGGAIAIAAVGVAAALGGLAPRPAPTREGSVFLGLLAALAAWSALSIAWSIQPDRSWDYANRGAVYLAFAVCGVLLASFTPRAPSRTARGLGLLLGLLVVWALAGKIFPGVEPDYERVARLRTPVGYWNALALLLDITLPLALWAASRRDSPAWARAFGAVLAYGALAALPLTYSRGGLALAALLAAGWIALSDERLEGLATLVVAGIPAGLTVALAFALPGVTDDGQPLSVRRHDGALFGLVLLLGALLVWGLAFLAARVAVSEERRRTLTRGGLAAFGLLLAAGLIGYAATTDWNAFFNPVDVQNTQGQARLSSVSSGNRWFWWQEAWHGFVDHPLKGTGGGTFDLTHRLLRKNALDATEPHELPLQFLTETGIVGFLLAAGAAVAALLGLWRVLQRRDEERPARVALALAAPAYLLYALVDFDWDFVAVTAPVMLVTGLLLTGPPRPAAPRRWLLASGVLVAGAACVYSLASPWLAARRVDEAYGAIGTAKAHSIAESAHNLNPLAIDPLRALSDAALALGDRATARAELVRATKLQPDNWEGWYYLGLLDYDAGNYCRAYFALNRAYTLDRWGLPGKPKGGPLDQTRALVNEGACG